jgi:hypothetical protein
MGWFLRALGELDEAYQANPMPFFRADVRLLQGRLPEVAAEGESVRSAIAAFLMGEETSALPPDALGLARISHQGMESGCLLCHRLIYHNHLRHPEKAAR